MRTFTAYIEYDPEVEMYVGIVPGMPGMHTQAETLDQLHENLKEVIALCLEEYGDSLEETPTFVGIQQFIMP